jgi:hypothetical protein
MEPNHAAPNKESLHFLRRDRDRHGNGPRAFVLLGHFRDRPKRLRDAGRPVDGRSAVLA